MERLPAPMATSWKDLGKPELTPKLKQTIIDGTLEQAGDRSVEQLARERDDVLLGLIRLRRKFAEAPASPARNVRSRKTT
jgi:hypothetical protein